MTKREMLEVFSLFAVAYPAATQFRGSIDDLRNMATFWADLCADIEYGNGIVAARELCKTSKFCPSIAEFREAARIVKVNSMPRISAVEKLKLLRERTVLALEGGQCDADY